MSDAIDSVLSGDSRWCVEHGSCLDIMRNMPDNSVDSIVTDAPYGLGKLPDPIKMLKAWLEDETYGENGKGFMGRKWDAFVPGPIYWKEAYRVLKPGGHALVFAGTRTVDLMGLSLRIAGFQPRDTIEFAYGSGMPKSKKLGDGSIGNGIKPCHEPVLLVRKPFNGTLIKNYATHGTGGLNIDACRVSYASEEDFENHKAQVESIQARGGSMEESWKNASDLSGASDANPLGRWPGNLLLQHDPECQEIGSKKIGANPTWDTPNRTTESLFTGKEVSRVRHAETSKDFHHQQGNPIGEETVRVYQCVEGCPVRLMDQQSGQLTSGKMVAGTKRATSGGYGGGMPDVISRDTIGDTGTASRFFAQFEIEDFDLDPFWYGPKPSRAQKDAGLSAFRSVLGGEATLRKEGSKGTKNPRAGSGRTGGSKNTHSTVKSLQLMRYLCKLVTPIGGVILDPYGGSGSTACAALLEGYRAILCEINDSDAEPYVRIARARIEYVASGEYARNSVKKKLPAQVVHQGQQSMILNEMASITQGGS